MNLSDPAVHTGALIQGIKNFALETGMAIATVSADGIHHVNQSHGAKPSPEPGTTQQQEDV